MHTSYNKILIQLHLVTQVGNALYDMNNLNNLQRL